MIRPAGAPKTAARMLNVIIGSSVNGSTAALAIPWTELSRGRTVFLTVREVQPPAKSGHRSELGGEDRAGLT